VRTVPRPEYVHEVARDGETVPFAFVLSR